MAVIQFFIILWVKSAYLITSFISGFTGSLIVSLSSVSLALPMAETFSLSCAAVISATEEKALF